MFLPLDQKPDWRNPPLVTLILVIANVMIFYIVQFNDHENEYQAYRYYDESGLAQIELKYYLKYRKADHAVISHPDLPAEEQMQSNADFQLRLQNDEIIQPNDPLYPQWKQKQRHFIALLDKSATHRYSLNPSAPSLITLFSNIFLHADNQHLWGNMIMLLLLGLGVEVLVGRLWFLAGYLFCGVCGDFLYIALYHNDYATGLGASGAISGILGMAAMIYGMRRIHFFYFLFVYFDYVRARAIWIIPMYIAFETIRAVVFSSNINVAAHVGGFIGGVVFIALLRLLPNTLNRDALDKNQRQFDYDQQYAQAVQLATSMHIDEAKTQFLALQQNYPDDINVLQQLFALSRYNPASEEYHQYAQRLLKLPGTDRATVDAIYETYRQYASSAKPKPRWSPELLCSLAMKFAAHKKLQDAEKITAYLLKAAADCKGTPAVLLALSKYYNGVDADKNRQYRQTLLQRYPDSQEAALLR